jgi:NADPH:quinone reductase-like Zn-dependent oxidoreductase
MYAGFPTYDDRCQRLSDFVRDGGSKFSQRRHPRRVNQRCQGLTLRCLEMIRKMPTVKGYSIRLVTGDEARRKVAVEYVTKGLASGALKPIIDRTFKFDEMVEVRHFLETSGQFGKIVVTL